MKATFALLLTSKHWNSNVKLLRKVSNCLNYYEYFKFSHKWNEKLNATGTKQTKEQ